MSIKSETPPPIKFTLRNPPSTYLHLNVITLVNNTPSQVTALDEITLRTYLTAALTEYLGITGTAIPINILKVDSTSGEAWVSLPREDERAMVAALTQWVGKGGGVVIRVVNRGSWLGGLIGNMKGEENG